MPWTVTDVDEFNSGLTQSQKRQWVHIANSVLRKCREENGSNCEAKAIRQANGVIKNNSTMKKEMRATKSDVITYEGYDIQVRVHEGREHLVVPVVLMTEGVHFGSGGPLLHTADELGRYEASWNGIPVVVDHPKEDGNFISANSPAVLDREKVGRVYNVYMDGNKLRGEAWIEQGRLGTVNSTALSYIKNKQPLEVSVGYFSDQEPITGEYQGKNYTAVARNFRPDHLALLPDTEGACNWEAGCGIRNNNKTKFKGGNTNEMIEQGKKKEAYVNLLVNIMGYTEKTRLIQRKLDAMDTDNVTHYIEEVYDDYFVYRINGRGNGPEFYQRTYTTSEAGDIEFGTEPVKVRKEVEFIQVNSEQKNFVRTKKPNLNNNKKEEHMSKNKNVSEGKQAKVNTLISNAATKFTADDEEWLSGLEESTLDKLIPETKEEPKPTANEGVTQKQAIEALQSQMKTTDDFLKLLPAEMQEQMKSGLQLHQAHKAQLVDTIVNNTAEGTWSKDELKGMDMSMLEKISKSVTPTTETQGQVDGFTGNYSGLGNPPAPVANSSDEDVFMAPAGVKIGEEKK